MQWRTTWSTILLVDARRKILIQSTMLQCNAPQTQPLHYIMIRLMPPSHLKIQVPVDFDTSGTMCVKGSKLHHSITGYIDRAKSTSTSTPPAIVNHLLSFSIPHQSTSSSHTLNLNSNITLNSPFYHNNPSSCSVSVSQSRLRLAAACFESNE